MTAETIHTCSYECDRPECIRAQRDELAARMTAQQPAAVDGGLTDEAIERALDAPLGLDHTLRKLIRGDTTPAGYSKVDVVRALLRSLAAQHQEPKS